jgi:hypothetical protein
VGHEEGDRLVVWLDYFGDKPTASDLSGCAPLTFDHFRFDATEPEIVRVSGDPPPEVEVVGAAGVVIDVGDRQDVSGAWPGLIVQLQRRERWSRVDEEQRRMFKSAAAAGYEKAQLRLAGQEQPRNKSSVRVEVGTHRAPALEGETDWSGLDALGCLTRIDVVGPDPAALAFACRRQAIDDFRWYVHGRKEIDLSASLASEVTVDLSGGGLRIVLSDRVTALTLVGDIREPIVVEHPRRGRGLSLVHERTRMSPRLIGGLEELERLSIKAPRALCIADVAYPKLRSLSVICDRIDDIAALGRLTELKKAEFESVFDFDVDALPVLPSLEHVTWEGVRKAHAPVLKKHFKGCEVGVSGAKKDKWIEAYLADPFHDWVYTHELMGKDASRAYKSALKTADVDKRMRSFDRAMDKLRAAHDLDAQHERQIDEARAELLA